MSKAQKLAQVLRDGMGISVDEQTAESLLRVVQTKGDSGYTQWMSRDGQTFSPASLTRKVLVPGLYEIGMNMHTGMYFDKLPVSTEGIIRLPDTASDKVLAEIQSFWDRESLFRQYGLTYKRGILLWGPPGSGKTSTIRMVSEDVVKRGGVVIKFSDPGLTSRGLRVFREVQPDTPCVVLMEDLDSILRYNPETEVINLLDGVDKLDKILFLATTNYPEQLGERVVNRPSRFDRRYLIGNPNLESREVYFNFLIEQGSNGGGKKPQDVDVKKWAKDTDGLSIAHLKELFVAVVILGTPYKQALATLKEMGTLPTSAEYRPEKMAKVMRMDDCDCSAPCTAADNGR